MTPRGPKIPNHHERQFMQHLEGSGWVKAFTMRSSPKVVEKMLTKGWIEKNLIEGRLCYRVTDRCEEEAGMTCQGRLKLQ